MEEADLGGRPSDRTERSAFDGIVALVIGSLPATARHPPASGDRRRQTCKEEVQSYPLGYFHIDIAGEQTAEGKLRLFVAIDHTSKFAYAQLHEKAGKIGHGQFLRNLIAAVPYTIHTVLTDNGIRFTNHARHKYAFHHIFDRVCDENGIEHRLTRINHPWTNGQVERMNRTIKNATVKRFPLRQP